MNVLIVEDELMAQKSLTRVLTQHFPDMNIVGTSTSVKGTVEWLNTPGNSADIIFMDVELSDGECFEIFRQTEVKAKVIMTTAYDSYALKAFETGSIDYLLKPVDATALKRAVARCRMSGGGVDVEALLKAIGSGKEHQKEYKERYIVRFNDRIIPVEVSNVAYVFSEDKNNYLVTLDNHQYILDSSLDVVMDDLNPDQFFRISRSYIVSINSIENISKHLGTRLRLQLIPHTDAEVVVSRSRTSDFLEWLDNN